MLHDIACVSLIFWDASDHDRVISDGEELIVCFFLNCLEMTTKEFHAKKEDDTIEYFWY